MDTNVSMTVESAIEMFTSIMCSLNEIGKQTFLSFIADNWKPQNVKIESLSKNAYGMAGDCHNKRSLQEEKLNTIKDIVLNIRNKVPTSGIFPSEEIVSPTIGQNSDCNPCSTKHVDAFLYDEKELDELIESGELNTLYCADCGSSNMKQYNIISHSLSVAAILYIFHSVLPSLSEKVVLDIGSRLGAVLYGAYTFTSAKKIIGVEMNKELCSLQNDIVNKYKMNDRIEIVNRRIEECPEIIQKSNIIIIHNPFEFYVSHSVHRDIWAFLKATIQSGTILVTKPSIETTFKNLKIKEVNKWVKPYEREKTISEPYIFASLFLDPTEYADIKFYEVI